MNVKMTFRKVLIELNSIGFMTWVISVLAKTRFGIRYATRLSELPPGYNEVMSICGLHNRL